MKRFFALGLFLLMISVLCSCTSATRSIRTSNILSNSGAEISTHARASFVKVKTILFASVGCRQLESGLEGCPPPVRLGQSHMSGAVIQTPDGNIGILTAAHGINADPRDFIRLQPGSPRVFIFKAIELEFSDGTQALANTPPTCDNSIDVCFLTVDSIPQGIGAIRYSPSRPDWGDVVWYAGNPLGVANDFQGILPIFRGYYSGDSNTNPARSIYTIFAAPGSSGSLILDHTGRFVGVVQAVHRHLPHVTVSLSYESLGQFLNEIDQPQE